MDDDIVMKLTDEIEELKQQLMLMAEKKDDYEELLFVSSRLAGQYGIRNAVTLAKELIVECHSEIIKKKA